MEGELLEARAKGASQAVNVNHKKTAEEKRSRRQHQSVPSTSAFRARSPEMTAVDKAKRRVTFESQPQIVTIDQKMTSDEVEDSRMADPEGWFAFQKNLVIRLNIHFLHSANV
jgi:hypothetical protein